jgi:hypothetical protein
MKLQGIAERNVIPHPLAILAHRLIIKLSKLKEILSLFYPLIYIIIEKVIL